MPDLYKQYQVGHYQEVYDALITMQEQVFLAHNYEDALLVAREIMQRVRYNIGLLIPRLHDLGYQFGKGFFQDMSPEERTMVENDAPIFQEPGPKTPEKVFALEELTGTLPLSLKCWYEEALPCKAFDAPLLLERHHTTFINYLRLCFQWGGFPGLEFDNRLSQRKPAFLTKDMLPF